MNFVVGTQPLPSCLGDGDLDGDEYSVIPLRDIPSFKSKGICEPAPYIQARKMSLDRPSTTVMVVLAWFIMDLFQAMSVYLS
ncbi:hypothetical protein BV22DRAFT_1038231 [Leucogyrophana mollusca]|uniref:Uncharacterized protein n=1 Tax=Leucogyrophana mollusca TaxID=85980 RepID=A0ACB8B8K0_9AGAM|nr:hypothetical protein BV22DRAFT_1038231 [Leucogyrophana mollusca]